ncbi:MAG: type transport system ATP-binding protein [Frankiaceae bacterium]|nr:type transport system ATP-binding protein [Frankiaceae bacterium]
MNTAAVSVREVTKTYRDGAVLANDRIDLDVTRGEVFGLLGPNGAGKSTLVRQLVGLTRPDHGGIEILGHDVVATPSVAGHLVGYLGQDEPALLDLPVHAAVTTTARLRGESRRAAAAQATDLVDELGLTAVAGRPLARLSGGQRRLACVASALAARRPLLLLDEPTAGLDPVARREVWAALGRRRDAHGVTVLLVTHNVTEAEALLDRVAILDRGRVIACDTPGRLKAAVSDDVRLDLVWRLDPPYGDPTVTSLAERAVVTGRRWTIRLAADEARTALGRLTSGAAFAALDDFTLATPSLEDVYLALGGRDDDLERA